MTVTGGVPWPPEDDRATRSRHGGRHRPAEEPGHAEPPHRLGPPQAWRAGGDWTGGDWTGGGGQETGGWQAEDWQRAPERRRPPEPGRGWHRDGSAIPAAGHGAPSRRDVDRPGLGQGRWEPGPWEQQRLDGERGNPYRTDDPDTSTAMYQVRPYRTSEGRQPRATVYYDPDVEQSAVRAGPGSGLAVPDATGQVDGTGVPPASRAAARRQPTRAAARRRQRRMRRLELPLLIAFSLITAVLVRTFVLQSFYIPSGSMHPTLLEGDRVIVNKLSYHLHDVHRGDVVVFRRPPKLHINDEDLIKRVIGLPGDTVAAHDRKVFVNGRALKESYIPARCAGTEDFLKVTVPADRVFVMGDNRCNSTDSRVFGPIPENLLVGRAFSRIWPVDRLGWL